MRVPGLLWFILGKSLRNRVFAQFRRMKRPRYLIATVFGLAYFWFFFARHLLGGVTLPALGPEVRVIAANALSVLAVPIALWQWGFARDRAALDFSEAEIQFLFPGPLSRSSLVLYRVGRTLTLVLLSALAAALIFGARLTGHPLFFIAGFWAALAALSLHEMAASLASHALFSRGVRGVAQFAGFGLLLGGVLAGLGYVSWRQHPLPPLAELLGEDFGLAGLAAWARGFENTPLGWALRPLRAPAELALAESPAQFARALPWAAGLVGLLAFIVLRSDLAFEEASVEAAEERARQAERRRGRRDLVAQAPATSFRLSASGRPETAVAWKGLVAVRRLLLSQLLRLVLPILVIALGLAVLVGREEGLTRGLGAAAAGLAIAAGALVVLGPNALRSDLRMDLQQMEILRTWPLSGAQIVSGELLGSAGLLALFQWLMLLASFAVSLLVPIPWLPLPLRLAVAVSALVLAPLVTLHALLIQNAAVLLFPSWVAQGPQSARGFEALGQRLVTFAGGLVVLGVGLLPALLLGGGVLAVLWFTVGPLGAPLAALVAAAVLALEAYVAILLLGRRFDRYDVTTE